MNLQEAVDNYEYCLIWNAIIATGSIQGAAKKLGSKRTTISMKMKRLGMSLENALKTRELLNAIEQEEIKKRNKPKHL